MPSFTMCMNISLGTTTQTLQPQSGQTNSFLLAFESLPQLAHISTMDFVKEFTGC